MRVVRWGPFVALAAVAMLGTRDARAAEPGLYVGFMYGDASRDYDAARFDAFTLGLYDQLAYVPAERSSTRARDEEAYGFFAGYRFTQHWAVEGGFLSLGKQSFRESSSGLFFTGDEEQPTIPESWNVSWTKRTTGFTVSALGILPISYAWELYARAGVFVASSRLDLWASNGTLTGRNRFSDSSIDFLAGAGISWSLAEVYAIRAEFQRVFDAGVGDFGEADVDVVTIGITVTF